MKPITLEITDCSKWKQYTKGGLIPLAGWPNGIDPYPELQFEDVVLSIRVEEKYIARFSTFGKVNLGEIVALEVQPKPEGLPLSFLIQEVKSNGKITKAIGICWCQNPQT